MTFRPPFSGTPLVFEQKLCILHSIFEILPFVSTRTTVYGLRGCRALWFHPPTELWSSNFDVSRY